MSSRHNSGYARRTPSQGRQTGRKSHSNQHHTSPPPQPAYNEKSKPKTKKINTKIQKLIDSIPENGAIGINKNSIWIFGEPEEAPQCRKAIGKINGHLEFFKILSDGTFETVYMWDYANQPELEEEHFDIENLPKKTGKIYESVFI